MTTSRPIIVFSHLRWDFVYQRPQQLISRLATKRRVLFVEEPLEAGSEPDGWELSEASPQILVARPRLSGLATLARAEVLSATSRLVRDLVRDEELADPIAWVYTPMAEPLLDAVEPSLVVYDCMDELSLFHGAPPELVRLESALLRRADLVFTGGVSLYEAKRKRHPRVHCFPSSVDAEHFAQARAPATGQRARRTRSPSRIRGWATSACSMSGSTSTVIDALAAAHPEWQIVMVGPTVKIDPATLPRAPTSITSASGRTSSCRRTWQAGMSVCFRSP